MSGISAIVGDKALKLKSLAVDDPENSRVLKNILSLTRAQLVDFPTKLKCCGGPLATREPELAVKMAREVVDSAKARGAEAIATACSLCHFMLDFYSSGLPILYFTQLLAYSMGMPAKDLGFEELFNHSRRVHSRGDVMCEGSAYLVEGSSKEFLMKEVVSLSIKEGALILANELGEERKLNSFKEVRVDIVNHKIKILI